MPYPALPAETTYTEVERNLIDNEPPGAFPEDQNSYWGQMRKVQADYMQANAVDLFTAWYNNLDPRAVLIGDISEWEARVGVPGDRSAVTLAARRTFVQNRLAQGAWTRARVNAIIENFINAVLVVGSGSTSFGAGGILLDASGATLYSGVSGDVKTMYRVYYEYNTRTQYVRILNTLGEDLSGLTRELKRILPAGWTLSIADFSNVLYYTRAILDLAPIGYYKLEGNANDTSQYTNNGTMVNTPTSTTSLLTIAADNGTGNGLLFNGTNQYVSVPDFSSTWPFTKQAVTTISFEAWVKPTAIPAAGGFRMAMSKGSWWLGMEEVSGSAYFAIWSGVGTGAVRSTPVVLSTTYHLVGTYDGTTLRLYVNGVLAASYVTAGASLGGPLFIGTWDTTQWWWQGTIDEAVLYDRVLTPEQILSHYKTGTNTP